MGSNEMGFNVMGFPMLSSGRLSINGEGGPSRVFEVVWMISFESNVAVFVDEFDVNFDFEDGII